MVYKRKDIYQEITDQISAEMEKGKLFFQIPWDGKIGNKLFVRPENAVTGRKYHDINAVYLMSVYGRLSKERDPRFCTFLDAKKNGWTIKKGSKGFSIKQIFLVDKDKEGNDLPKEKQYWRHTYSVVFHASQLCRRDPKTNEITAIPIYEQTETGYKHEEKIQLAEEILKNSKAVIFNDQPNRAYYELVKDEIHLPPKEAFSDLEKYYASALHELAHWTGHKSRLNRLDNDKFGSMNYAKEELRAQMASAFLSMEIGIPLDVRYNAAYTQDWLQALKNDKKEFFRAAKDAEKIATYVMGFVKQRNKSQENTEEQPKEVKKEFDMEKRCQAIANERKYLTLAQKYRYGVNAQHAIINAPWQEADKVVCEQLIKEGYPKSRIQKVIQENSPIARDKHYAQHLLSNFKNISPAIAR